MRRARIICDIHPDREAQYFVLLTLDGLEYCKNICADCAATIRTQTPHVKVQPLYTTGKNFK